MSADVASNDIRPLTLRLATAADVPALNTLIEHSARLLSRGFYTEPQTEAAILYVFGVDSGLIADRTYFVVEDAGEQVACGGWSRRCTLYGGDQRPMGAGSELDPRIDAARIRAFFVRPTHARRGIGSMLLSACASAAAAAGYSHLELMSTLPGVPFYSKLGFEEIEHVSDPLPDGTALPFVRMGRTIDPNGLILPLR